MKNNATFENKDDSVSYLFMRYDKICRALVKTSIVRLRLQRHYKYITTLINLPMQYTVIVVVVFFFFHKKLKISFEKFDIFNIYARTRDCGYMLGPPRRVLIIYVLDQ